ALVAAPPSILLASAIEAKPQTALPSVNSVGMMAIFFTVRNSDGAMAERAETSKRVSKQLYIRQKGLRKNPLDELRGDAGARPLARMSQANPVHTISITETLLRQADPAFLAVDSAIDKLSRMATFVQVGATEFFS